MSDAHRVATFEAIKVTIRSLADEQGVSVAEDEYPCNMLAALVHSIAAGARRRVAHAPEDCGGECDAHRLAEARALLDSLRVAAEAEIARLRAALAEARREIEELRRLAGPHRHSFTWSESASADSGPPPDATCDCGMAYRDVVAPQEREGEG